MAARATGYLGFPLRYPPFPVRSSEIDEEIERFRLGITAAFRRPTRLQRLRRRLSQAFG